jgi:hypothetical protein
LTCDGSDVSIYRKKLTCDGSNIGVGSSKGGEESCYLTCSCSEIGVSGRESILERKDISCSRSNIGVGSSKGGEEIDYACILKCIASLEFLKCSENRIG